MSGERDFVIWSHQHQQWWKPDRQGYTSNLLQAGLYTAEEAGDIVVDIIPPGTEVAMRRIVAERHGPRLCFGYSE